MQEESSDDEESSEQVNWISKRRAQMEAHLSPEERAERARVRDEQAARWREGAREREEQYRRGEAIREQAYMKQLLRESYGVVVPPPLMACAHALPCFTSMLKSLSSQVVVRGREAAVEHLYRHANLTQSSDDDGAMEVVSAIQSSNRSVELRAAALIQSYARGKRQAEWKEARQLPPALKLVHWAALTIQKNARRRVYCRAFQSALSSVESKMGVPPDVVEMRSAMHKQLVKLNPLLDFLDPVPWRRRDPDIGEWLATAARSERRGEWDASERLLLDPHAAAATRLPPAAVSEIMRGASGPRTAVTLRGGALGAEPVELCGVLDGAQRAALVARMDSAVVLSAAADARRDLKLELQQADLHALIGSSSADALANLGRQLLVRLGGADGPPPMARLHFWLRRREAVEGSEYDTIPFHRDVSLVVVNAALNDDFDGARLIFAVGNKLVVPPRAAGDATAHDCTVVHAVSRLARGVRYNLYALFDAVPAPAA